MPATRAQRGLVLSRCAFSDRIRLLVVRAYMMMFEEIYEQMFFDNRRNGWGNVNAPTNSYYQTSIILGAARRRIVAGCIGRIGPKVRHRLSRLLDLGGGEHTELGLTCKLY